MNFEERAQAIAALERANEQMFSVLRAEIRSGRLRGEELLRVIRQSVPSMDTRAESEKYDALDSFMTGLLLDADMPRTDMQLEPEMVAYQRTPSKVVFDVARHVAKDDVFYDLGSGLGEVPIVIHLLTGAIAKGVELVPQYCEYARLIAQDLNLPGVSFINEDVRRADFRDGTAFFLYTPFTGQILDGVMERIHAIDHPLRVFTYGPCTEEVARLDWLRDQYRSSSRAAASIFASLGRNSSSSGGE